MVSLSLPLTLKGPGFFVYLKSGGGGGGGGISPAERRKNSEIWHVRSVSRYERADEIAILKIKAFWIMQIYVNYMHVFLILIITDKMRPFGAFKLFWYCHRNI